VNKFAVKEFKPEFALDSIIRESIMMDMLCSEENENGHNNIIPLYKIIKDGSRYSLVMEYIDDMYYQILYPLLTPREVQFYAYELLKAIAYMHDKNIIHKDIKPHNVLIDRSKKILKLVDWGSADIYREGEEGVDEYNDFYYYLYYDDNDGDDDTDDDGDDGDGDDDGDDGADDGDDGDDDDGDDGDDDDTVWLIYLNT